MGHLPLPLLDGSVHLQPCYYHPQASDTIISPQCDTQVGYADGRPGALIFYGNDTSTALKNLPLDYKMGCTTLMLKLSCQVTHLNFLQNPSFIDLELTHHLHHTAKLINILKLRCGLAVWDTFLHDN